MMKKDRSEIYRKVKAKLGIEPTPEPTHKTYLRNWGVDVDKLEWTFRSLRVTQRDAFLDINGSAIRLIHLFDPSTKTSRRKLKAEHYLVIREFKDDPKNPISRVAREDVVQELRKLDAQREQAVQGRIICKAPLVSAIKQFDAALKAYKKNPNSKLPFIYRNSSARARLIAAWVNWFFKIKYGYESTYKPEQIRKIIAPPKRRSPK